VSGGGDVELALWTAVLAVLVLLAYAGMLRGWRRRAAPPSARPPVAAPAGSGQHGGLRLESGFRLADSRTHQTWVEALAPQPKEPA
jgi:hypothetical protein